MSEPSATCGFADRLDTALRKSGTPACVGLDPVLERLPRALGPDDPSDAIRAFCEGVLGAVAGIVPVVKFQSACFERFGAPGVAALSGLIDRARRLGLLVILDAKRGDIGTTNEHYAAAAAAMGADALTLSGYLGMGVVEPFLKAGLGVFILVRTSNPDGDQVQSCRLADGRTVAELLADGAADFGRRWMGRCGMSDIGAVVGATKAAEGAALRRRMPRQVILIPGYGAQGGTAGDVRALVDGRGGGVLVTASRSVIYSFGSDSPDWQPAIRAAAERFAGEVRPFLA